MTVENSSSPSDSQTTASDAVELPPLMARQKQLEEDGMAQGKDRFKRRLEQAQQSGKESTVGAARKLLQGGLEPMTKLLNEILLKPAGKGSGKRHTAAKWVKMLGAEVSAFLALKVILDGLSGDRLTIRRAALDITELMVDELRYRRFKKEAPALFEHRMSKFQTSNYAHMARSMDATLSYGEIDTSDLEMSQRERLLVGMKLIDILISATGLVEPKTEIGMGRGGKPKKETFLSPTEETSKWITERNEVLQAFYPINLPMVVPPTPWSPGRRGGYMFSLLGKHPLVRGITKAQAKVVATASMPTVYSAVNRIQETPWKVNQDVLRLLEEIVERGGGLAGVPEFGEEELPPRPLDIETNEDVRKAWRRAAGQVKERNHARKVKRMEFFRTLKVAQDFRNEDSIWFPYNLDFRGRVYPVVNYLHPQGDDLAKGLLQFAQGKPLGRDGIGWLALHGANCLGQTPEGVKLTKATLQERADWISENTERILKVASDPFGDLWWADKDTVDDPLQFFAFCVEWARFVEMEQTGRGHEYVSALPCAMDGTCNGLQHFAALFLDPIGAKSVNVTPNERPQDIYQRIADVVLERLEKEAASNEFAALWLKSGLVNRKLAKRPTMTFGYGSKKYGFKQQLIDYVRGLNNWPQLKPMFVGDEGRSKLPSACGYMSLLIWEALGEVVVAASKGMAWMQEVARAVGKNKKCVAWTVPGTGFPVRQEYFKVKSYQVRTVLAGRVTGPSAYDDTAKIDTVKQANAVAPNFVHSLDAAALMLTVDHAAGSGVDHFGMVHDSYATHAADAPVLAHCTREAFFQLYARHNVINDFAGQLIDLVKDPDEFPEAPPKGALDLSCVLASDYFFS